MVRNQSWKCSHNARDLIIDYYRTAFRKQDYLANFSMAAAVPQEGKCLHFLRHFLSHRNHYRTTYPRSSHQVNNWPQSIVILRLTVIRSIRNRLTVLKRDRGEYIKPSDVNSLYQAVVKQGLFLPYQHQSCTSLRPSH